MKEKRETDLQQEGYSLDKRGLRQLQRPYILPSIIGLLGFIIVLVLILKSVLSLPLGLLLLLLTWCIIIGSIAFEYFAKPTSLTTGKPLEKYKNIESDGLEILFVDPDTKTYFKRLYGIGDTNLP